VLSLVNLANPSELPLNNQANLINSPYTIKNIMLFLKKLNYQSTDHTPSKTQDKTSKCQKH
jgi:hypothetical protein